MRAGTLRHRVRIERPVRVDLGGGASEERQAPVPSKASDGTWAAAIEPLSSRELVAAAAAQMLTSHRITLRYVEGLDNTCAIIEKRHGRDRVFHIASVIDVGEAHREHQVLAIEKVA